MSAVSVVGLGAGNVTVEWVSDPQSTVLLVVPRAVLGAAPRGAAGALVEVATDAHARIERVVQVLHQTGRAAI